MVHSDSERRDSSASEEGIAGAFLFKGVSVSGPLEELAATVEKKVRMYTNLGEVRNAERTQRAHELARAKLEAVLAAPLSPSQRQPDRIPGDQPTGSDTADATEVGGS